MATITLELNNKQIESIVERLPLKEKLQWIRKLEKETLRQRWNEILDDIDSRLKKFPISGKEIANEIEAYRKEKYAKGRN